MPWPDERGSSTSNKPVKDLIDEAVAKLDAGIAMLNHVKTDVGLRCKANADQAPAIHGEAVKHHADGDPRRVTLYAEVVNWRSLVFSLVNTMVNGFNAQLPLTELTHPGGATIAGGSQPTQSARGTPSGAKPGLKLPSKPASKPAVPAPSKAPAPKPPAAKPPPAPAPKSAPKPPPKAPPKPPPGRGR